MTQIIIYSLEHALEEIIKILPFLFFTYVIMEFLEKKNGEGINRWLEKTGKTGPVIGAIAGVVPQCGVSAVAANLYAGRVISLGTLLAVFLSTSDEMIPIMLSNFQNLRLIGIILFLKVLIAVIAGLLLDFFICKFRIHEKHENGIHEFCEHQNCHCEDGIIKSAVRHTFRIGIYIFIVTVLLNIGIEIIGEETLGNFILNKPVLGPVLAGIIGLIPNCVASVVITTMFLDGLMSFGTMMTGLLVGAGVGLLVLLRVNDDKKESLGFILILYFTGVIVGILLNTLL